MKGELVEKFQVGQSVLFSTDSQTLRREDVGVIVKLYKSGKSGRAKIRLIDALPGLPPHVTRSLRTVRVLTP